jgi:hypothetical protein
MSGITIEVKVDVDVEVDVKGDQDSKLQLSMLSMEHNDIDVYEQYEDEYSEPWCWDITDSDITIGMLRKRKDIRETIISALKEAFPEKYDEEEDISDESIIEMVNMDPEVKASLIEILLELTDCQDQEGETSYYPSISEYTCADEIMKIDKVIVVEII